MDYGLRRWKSGVRSREARWGVLLPLLLTSYFLLLFTGCSRGGDTWERIERETVIVVGLDPSFPPFESVENDQLVGIDIDLARAMAEFYGLDVRFEFIGYDGLYDALLTKRVDVLLSGMIVDASKTKEFAFGEGYFNAGQVRVEGKGESEKGKVAVELGAEGHVIANNLEGVEVLVMDSAELALQSVLDGSATSAITDNISASLFVATHPSLTVSEELTVLPFAAVTRIEDSDLRKNLDTALLYMIENGQYAQILEKWGVTR